MFDKYLFNFCDIHLIIVSQCQPWRAQCRRFLLSIGLYLLPILRNARNVINKLSIDSNCRSISSILTLITHLLTNGLQVIDRLCYVMIERSVDRQNGIHLRFCLSFRLSVCLRVDHCFSSCAQSLGLNEKIRTINWFMRLLTEQFGRRERKRFRKQWRKEQQLWQ